MHRKTKWIAVIMVLALLSILLVMGVIQLRTNTDGELETVLQAGKDDVILWYTDEHLTDYLNSAALEYKEQNDVKVIPVLMSGVEYLESINQASVSSKGNAPDLYIASNDMLAKAYLAGIAAQITDSELCNIDALSQTALDAVSYKNKYVGYPYYYETSFLLYNRTYLEDSARQNLERAADEAEGTAAMEAISAAESEAEGIEEVAAGEESAKEITQEEVSGEMDSLIPKTIDDILNFADFFEAPEQVENVFKWDVSDIFYNYFFVGNYITVGGEAGDDYSQYSIYNQETIDCLSVYQNLNQFFSIDTGTVTYATVLQEFLEGKTVFTAATTDAISLLEEAKAAGEFNYEYGVATIPDISAELSSRGLSVTNAIVLNEYSHKQEEANAFAKYLVTHTEQLMHRTGKVACYKQSEVYETKQLQNVLQAYEASISIPKMIEASNFWVQLEMVFSKVWNGSSPEDELKALSDQIGGQIDEGIDILNITEKPGTRAGAAKYME